MISPTPRFRRTSRFRKGYAVSEVDAFFTRAKTAHELAGRRTGIMARPPADTVTAGTASEAPTLTAQQVRTTAFTLRFGGYVTAEVDLALDRLEDALAGLERARIVDAEGEDGLVERLTEAAGVLRERVERGEGERFSRGLRGWERTYDTDQVDALCDRLRAHFDGDAQMGADEVRRAAFRARRGNLGYREAEVDAFLDRVVSVMVST